MTDSATFVDDYLPDLGPDDADITSHDAYTSGVPHATFHPAPQRPTRCTGPPRRDGSWLLVDPALRRCARRSAVTSRRSPRPGGHSPRGDGPTRRTRSTSSTMMEIRPPRTHPIPAARQSKGFTRRTVESYEDSIRQLADRGRRARAASKGEFDFVHEIAEELPMRMLGRLLGTERRATAASLWPGVTHCSATPIPDFTDFPGRPRPTPTSSAWCRSGRRRRSRSSGTPRSRPSERREMPTATTSSPSCSNRPVDGQPLTDLEFNNFFTLLVAAGNDTTRYTMTHGLWNDHAASPGCGRRCARPTRRSRPPRSRRSCGPAR